MPDMRTVVLATCERWPDISTSDAVLAAELQRRGHHVRAQSWNGGSFDVFATADIVVLRSNWDFHHDLVGFALWLDALDQTDVAVHNPTSLVRDYLDKSYLVQLVDAGFPTPATLYVNDLDDRRVDDWLRESELERVVLKPAWGASGHGVELVETSELASVRSRWRNAPEHRDAILQAFAPQIRNGERSLVFFDGVFSHGLLRSPGDDDFRVNSQYGGSMTLADDIDAPMIELGQRVIDSFDAPATYARIDMVGRNDDLVLMEVEVNEPALGLDLAPGAAAAFADAILRVD